MEISKKEMLELLKELKNDISGSAETLEIELNELLRTEKFEFILKEVVDTLRNGNEDFKYQMENTSRKKEIETKQNSIKDYNRIITEIENRINMNTQLEDNQKLM